MRPLVAGSRIASLLALATLSVAGLAPSAGERPETLLDLRVPAAANAGEELELRARLTDAGGAPIPGVLVGFYSLAEFAGVSGEVILGEGVTGADGVTTLRYVPRREGEIMLAARFPGSPAHGPGRAMGTLSVGPGPPLYRETPWIRVPGIVWALVALLSAVWATYLSVMVLLLLIARDGRVAAPEEVRR